MKVKIGRGEMTFDSTLAALAGGTLFRKNMQEASFAYVATDSREADGETLFAALRGERVDGHDYMEKAALFGCKLFLCERVPKSLMDSNFSFGAILVEDTELAIGKLAAAYADSIRHETVAVTGSVGKTTTKEMIAAVLEEKFNLHKTKANHNSTLGMPMSLLEMTDENDASVLEMGMSGFGEISYMSKIGKPDIACITTIGTSHMEVLGSRENICRAKLEILDGLSPTGTLILNGDEPLLSTVRGGKYVYVSVDNADSDLHAVNIRYGDGETVFDVERKTGETMQDLFIPAIGKPFVYGALFGVAVGLALGMTEEKIAYGLGNFRNAAMRQNISECGGITIIEDCYNASPESMRAAADILRTVSEQRDGARRVALLGDMKELGESSPELHKNVGKYFALSGLDVLVTAGELAVDIARGAMDVGMDNVISFANSENRAIIADAVHEVLHKGDILLVKASRAIGAEKTLDLIREKL